jgi:cysteine synthase A
MSAICLDVNRAWTNAAVEKLNADLCRSADTHLIPVDLPAFPSINFYLKDESVHPSGSLKHRLARSLFLYAIVNGWVREGTTVIENSSGSTAVSEAYFAKLLGLPFIAVCPSSTSPQKLELIRRYRGEVHHVAHSDLCEAECRRLAAALPNAHYMDQFTFAERATDYRGNNNIAESLFAQMAREAHPEPAFVCCGAGTGGTSATLGRYVRYKGLRSCVVVADPENSVFFDYFQSGDAAARSATPSIIEGIGRTHVERSFIRTSVDAMVRVPDAMSIGAVLFLEDFLGRRVGASTGTIFCAALTMALHMAADGRAGSIAAILCDSGDRYSGTVYSAAWREARGMEAAVAAARARVAALCCPRGSGGGGGGGGGAAEGGSSGGAPCGYCPPDVIVAAADWPCKAVTRPDAATPGRD